LQAAFFSPCEGHWAIAPDTIIAIATAITLNIVFMILFLSSTASAVRPI
jgi:hypothetical protein